MAEYIEREAAIMELCRGCSLRGISDSFFCGEPCPKYERIASVPAADVVSVRHGRWRLYSPLTDTYECDKCGYQVIDESFRTNYCPNCGAKMGETL